MARTRAERRTAQPTERSGRTLQEPDILRLAYLLSQVKPSDKAAKRALRRTRSALLRPDDERTPENRREGVD
jgi:hypothetical protein